RVQRRTASLSSTSEGFFAITHGEAAVVRRTDAGSVPLAKLGQGDFMGPIPFLDIGHEPHSAVVYVSEDFKVKGLDIEALQQEYEGLSVPFQNIIEHVASCVSVTTMVASELRKKLAQ
ncbi:cyclic nucleotide-binding domain-containing protein, partial [Thermodesulfobacteriota bacterium]